MSECTWTKEEHESTAVECTAHGMIDAAKATRMLAEIERLQARLDPVDGLEAKLIERTAEISHAHDAANKLYQAAQQTIGTWDLDPPAVRSPRIDDRIAALRAALDPAEAEASAREAARRDKMEQTIRRLTKERDDAIKAHEEADERAERASRGLSKEEAQRWADMVESTDDGTWIALMRASRGDIPEEVRKVDPPDPDRPTDASRPRSADAFPGRCGQNIGPFGTCGRWATEGTDRCSAHTARRLTDAAPADLPEIQSTATDAAITEAIEQAKASSAPAEDPPTQPPHRERCKPIAGPWVNGATFDERGSPLGSALPSCASDSATWTVYVNRPHMPPHVSTVSSESAAMTAIRDSLASWCDVSALTLPEAP